MGRKVVSGAQGRYGKVFIDGQELCVTKWDAEHSADEQDTTNSCSQGWSEAEFGNQIIEGTIEADWDADLSPYGPPYNLTIGDEFVAKLYIHAANDQDNPRYEFHAKVRRIGVSDPTVGKVTFTIGYRSVGPNPANLPILDASG